MGQPKRRYKCKESYKEVDEENRAQLTILEYDVKNMGNGMVAPFYEINVNLDKNVNNNDKLEVNYNTK